VSPLSSPQFLEGFVTFKDVAFEKNLVMIVDIKTVTFKNKTDPIFSNIAWTVVPLFSPDGYILSGIYQIPLFQGSIPKDIVDKLPLNDPWPFIEENMKGKKPLAKYWDYTSVIVRVLDGQREGHFSNPYDYERMNYQYLPVKNRAKWIYNIAVAAKLSKADKYATIVPNKEDPKKFNKKITEAFINKFGFVKYKLD